MDVKDMNEGVQMVLARIASHPEEFVDNESTYSGKWHGVIDGAVRRVEGNNVALSFLNDDEVQAIYDALRQARRDAFTASVMRKITGSESVADLQEQLQSKLEYNLSKGRMAVAPQPVNNITTGHPAMNSWGNPLIASSTTPIKP